MNKKEGGKKLSNNKSDKLKDEGLFLRFLKGKPGSKRRRIIGLLK